MSAEQRAKRLSNWERPRGAAPSGWLSITPCTAASSRRAIATASGAFAATSAPLTPTSFAFTASTISAATVALATASHPIAAFWTAYEGGRAWIIATEQGSVGTRPIEHELAHSGSAVGSRQRREERAERLPAPATNEARQRVLAAQQQVTCVARPMHVRVDGRCDGAPVRQLVGPNENRLARAGIESAQPIVESMLIHWVG